MIEKRVQMRPARFSRTGENKTASTELHNLKPVTIFLLKHKRSVSDNDHLLKPPFSRNPKITRRYPSAPFPRSPQGYDLTHIAINDRYVL